MNVRRSVRGVIAVLSAVAGLAAGQSGAFAATFTSGTVGYDISYPQCGSAYPTGVFGVIGVNAGYPFTYYNTCFASEWSYAQQGPSPSLYINTGYDPSYTNSTDGRHTTQDCLNRSAIVSGTSAQRKAWAVGCSEAERSVEWASCGDNVIPSTCSNTVSPASWWLDVELANSWCGRPGTHCKDLSLNQYTIQGILDTLHSAAENPSAAPVGIYSTPSAWSSIVGGTSVTGIDADWRATGVTSESQAQSFCGNSGFTGSSPVWLVQFLPGSYDADYAC